MKVVKAVDRIVVNTCQRWFTLEGAISDTFDL
jgi:hypothetical protein